MYYSFCIEDKICFSKITGIVAGAKGRLATVSIYYRHEFL